MTSPIVETPVDPGTPAGVPRRDLVQGILGFVLAGLMAGIVALALFGLVFVPWIPRGLKLASALAASTIGIFQASYVVPIYLWGRRKGAGWLCAGLRQGAVAVLLANIAFITFAAFWPSPQD